MMRLESGPGSPLGLYSSREKADGDNMPQFNWYLPFIVGANLGYTLARQEYRPKPVGAVGKTVTAGGSAAARRAYPTKTVQSGAFISRQRSDIVKSQDDSFAGGSGKPISAPSRNISTAAGLPIFKVKSAPVPKAVPIAKPIKSSYFNGGWN